MASLLVELADAVVADLNATDFDLEFEAVRKYVPKVAREDLAELTVLVRPGKKKSTRAARGILAHKFTIEIAILRGVNLADEDAEVDPLTELAEAIEFHFLANHVANRDEPVVETDILLIDPKSLTENAAFHSIVTLTLQGMKNL